ncbi:MULTISPECIES: hypothetical protein [Streptomyces]|uniref:hypothetical protein n=1 Tax=Streptomyces TaxID=1883 RepID=UPI0006AE188E|nr:hypothetical protein [Streptomyces sp. AS58]
MTVTLTILGLAAAGIGAVALVDRQPAQATQVPGDRMAELLKDTLPPGATRQARGTGTRSETGASAEIQYDEGRGFGRVALSVGRLPGPVSEVGCLVLAHYPYEQCTDTTLADGSRLVMSKGYEVPTDPTSPRRWYAEMTTRDGEQVHAVAWSPEKGTAADGTRIDPPLSVGQLTDIVTAQAWKAVIEVLPGSPPPAREPANGRVTPVLEKARIQSTLKNLLPTSLRTARESGSPKGYASLTVDDGKGESLIEVTVQRWKPDSVEMRKAFANAATRPDGSRFVTRKTPSPSGNKGEFQWEADILHPDGLRIHVGTLNTAAFGLPVNRPAPALTTGQLAAIALADDWKR